MRQSDWAPVGVDIERPSAARAYDFLLGGSHNFAADREAARQAIAIMPDVIMQAKANRAFLRRAVRFLVGAGVRQFLDLGSGIPTVGNVHEIAQREASDTTVVYVDRDPVAVAHSRQLLADNPTVTAVRADFRDPGALLRSWEVLDLLDLAAPVAILMVGVLHYVPDADDPHAVVSRFRDAVVPGSYLAISHPTHEGRPEWVRLAEASRNSPSPVVPRLRTEIAEFFQGFDLVDPGLVWAPSWRGDGKVDGDQHPERSSLLAGVALRGSTAVALC